MDDLEELLWRIGHTVMVAYAHYETWFTLRGKGKALPKYYEDMNDHRYVDFFYAVNSGNYKLIFIELGCLFDTDDRSASIRNLKVELNKIGRNDLVQHIEQRLGAFEKLVSNVLTIRSKLMAHKEIGASSEEVHKKYGVVPNDIKSLIEECCSLINEVHDEVMGKSHTLLCATTTQRFEKATFNLLDVLRKGRS